MNIEKHLILVKGEDRTEEISSCKYEKGKWLVQYTAGKTYPYNHNSIKWLKNPQLLDASTTVIYQNNQPLSGVGKIFDFADYIRVCFITGYRKVYDRQEVKIEQSCLKNPRAYNVFEYLKQLAQRLSVTDEKETSFLSKQYERITYVSPSSVLEKYLHPIALQKPHKRRDGNMPIFPFGFNLSQKAATENALTEQISVIEGPPGTGKTQTILNIIANAIINGETVAVVSNNNSATANVLEKLQKYGVGFVAAYLGNHANKTKFFAEQSQNYPDMTSWVMDSEVYNALKQTIEVTSNELKEMLEAKNEVALLKEELSALAVEKEYFNRYYNESTEGITPYRSLYNHDSDTVLALWLDYQQSAKMGKPIDIKYKLKNLFKFGIFSFSFYKNSTEKVIACLQKLYYERREEELTEQIERLTKRLESYRFDDSIKEYSENSMKLLKSKLSERYSGSKNRRKFTKESLWRDFDSFIREYPVILSTTHSLRTCCSNNYLFDYVIMDEASQVDIVTGALALSCARNSVIVGDLKQLPNVVPQDIEIETNRIFDKYALDPAYRYAEQSMLSSIVRLYDNVPRTLLKEHYRCHPKIIGFCNQKFYNNELIIMTDEEGRGKSLVAYKTAKGNHARGKYNQRQIDVILQEVIPEQIGKGSDKSVGVISPYRLQTNKLKKALENKNIEVDTVHKYQGREKDVIIISTVVNETNQFVDDPNLINVAVSRAVDKLIIVVADDHKRDNSNIGDLIRYIEYNNFEIIDSNIYSVFDLLYRTYSKKLLTITGKRKKVSGFESENLMNFIIEKVLKEPGFLHLDRVIHQPLKMLIRNPEKLNEAECKYAMNVLTHTDFVIFNKIDKMPVLVVEVDGYAFHANNPRQLERDKMKDTILQKYGIPILRIKTNESGEETRLRNKLLQVLN